MGFQIGAFRFDRYRYNTYTVCFKDISGLTRKADVKIAGVKVGFVKSVSLLPGEDVRAQADVMILSDYVLYKDAHAVVRQDGLLGPKYVEIIPGDPLAHQLESGGQLSKPSMEPVSIDELLLQFKNIAANVQDVSESLKDSIGGHEGTDQIRTVLRNLTCITERLSEFSEMIEGSFERNQDSIDTLLQTGNQVRRLVSQLEDGLIPTFQESIEKVSSAIDRDLGQVAARFNELGESFEEISAHACDSLRNVNSVAEKVNNGKGLIGKLVNEDESYHDLRIAVQGLKNYVTKVDRLQIVFDSHFEVMQRRAENYRHEDSKGYLDMRIYPNQDHFYLIQLASSEKGFVYREEIERMLIDQKNPHCDNFANNKVDVLDFAESNSQIEPLSVPINTIFTEQVDVYKRNTIKFGLQFGKIFGNIALRFGLFEGTAGAGVDVNIPLYADKLRWVTTLEAFDMRGWNRRDDRRPHLKWLNRMFFLRNVFLTFGADDFISKNNASTFFGAGLRFGDDDIKYLLSSFSGSNMLCD